MGSKSGSAKVEVAEYRMSIHFGICAGPVDALLGIAVGEKDAWTGEVKKETAVVVNAPDLFGGVKKQGGVKGIAYYLPGGRMQILIDALASRLGKTRDTCPGFRGLASIFFIGDGSDTSTDSSPPGGWLPGLIGEIIGGGESGDSTTAGAAGFYWGANSPYLQSIWAKVRRVPRGLNPAIARIGDDANPSHIIFECLVNTDWGMGASIASVDVGSFETSAQTLYDENFGLSMMWARSDTIEAFVTEVLSHIQALLFTHPRTGLLTLKLLRDDYDHDDVPTINPDNATLSKFQRKLLGETTNEMVVTWTNPENEKAETVTAQDLANIAMQVDVVSDSRNYYGARSGDLAMRLAQRDLRAAALPLLGCESELDRTRWAVVPGDVLNLSWPEYDVASVLVRVLKADYGKPTDPKIKVVLVEDIFGLETSTFTTPPPGTSWTDSSEAPAPIQYCLVVTAPAFLLVNTFDEAKLESLADTDVIAAVIAAQDSRDTSGFDLYGEVTGTTGDLSWSDLGSKSLASTATLTADITAAPTTLIASFTGPIGAPPIIGTFVFIGTGNEDETEIALVSAIDDTGFTLLRGVLDTTPKPWTAGTRLFFVRPTANVADETIRSAGETAEYKVLTQTSRGLLSIDDAPINSATLTDRPHLPLRPANFKIGATGFGTFDATALDNLTASWANRNRLSETSIVLHWDDANVTPEAGQTTILRFLDPSGTFIQDLDALPGTSATFDNIYFGINDHGFVQALAKRDGLESLQGHEIAVTNLEPRYGRGYGLKYGG